MTALDFFMVQYMLLDNEKWPHDQSYKAPNNDHG